MKQRVITGVLAAIVFIGALFLMNTIVFPIFLACLSVVAVFEVEKAVGLKNKAIYTASLLLSAAIPFIFHFNLKFPVAVFGGIYVVLILIFMLLQFEKTKFEEAITAIFASVAIPYSFSLMIAFRDIDVHFPMYTKTDGVYLILFSYFVAWMTDIFAYFIGSKFGKHKLCPKISPKKTWAGLIGGMATAAAWGFGCAALDSLQNYAFVMVVSAVLAAVSQGGDLFESWIKRYLGVKDSGDLIPGHGGIFDRTDALLAVTPIVVLILAFFPELDFWG